MRPEACLVNDRGRQKGFRAALGIAAGNTRALSRPLTATSARATVLKKAMSAKFRLKRSQAMRVSTKNLRHIQLTLPLPPGESDRLAVWAKRAAGEVLKQLPAGYQPLAGSIRLQVRAGIVDQQRDVARVTLPILALLTDEHVINGVITDVDCKWDRIIESGYVRLEISQTTSPISRVPAAARRRAGEASLARRAAELASTAA
jgi:hypothetical protein